MVMILAFGIMLLCVAAMAVGVLMGRKPISGSCGGLANLGIDGECEICGGNRAACPSEDGPVSNTRQLEEVEVTNAAKPHLDA